MLMVQTELFLCVKLLPIRFFASFNLQADIGIYSYVPRDRIGFLRFVIPY